MNVKGKSIFKTILFASLDASEWLLSNKGAVFQDIVPQNGLVDGLDPLPNKFGSFWLRVCIYSNKFLNPSQALIGCLLDNAIKALIRFPLKIETSLLPVLILLKRRSAGSNDLLPRVFNSLLSFGQDSWAIGHDGGKLFNHCFLNNILTNQNSTFILKSMM